MIESIANFGPTSGLVGVLAEPENRSPSDLAVVILNAGVIHRVGPGRLHVRLARTLARAGLPAFRLDMAGIGDSDGLGSSESQDEECMMSIAAALDLLEARGTAHRFILYGACSGAVYAFRYARRDARVVGVVGSDPETLERTRKYYWVRALSTVRRPIVWYRFLRGHYGVLRRLRTLLTRSRATGQRSSVDGQHHEKRKRFGTMVEREVRLLLVVTGWGKARYNYENQFFDMFPGLGLERFTRITFLPGADHTFSRESDRRVLESELLNWVGSAPFRPLVPGQELLDRSG